MCVYVCAVMLLLLFVQTEEQLFGHSVTSVTAASASLRRTLLRAFADPATSQLAYSRVLAYFRAPSGVFRGTYDDLIAAAPSSFLGQDG